MLTLCEIDKSYGKNHALDHFSHSFDNGIHALLGPNGSGKSTLMNIITRNLRADSGTILLDGQDTAKMKSAYFENIGFMPQNTGMYPGFTVYEMLAYIARLKGLDRAAAREQIFSLLETVELDDVADRKISALSGGMRQRVALVQALLGDPRVILLDEPTAGLDPKQRIIVRNLISRYALHHTVLLATHVVSDVESVARSVIFLKKGVIDLTGTVEEVASRANGTVRECRTDEERYEQIRTQYRVLNLSRTRDEITVRFLAPPDAGIGDAVKPTLEDSYLYTFDDLEVGQKEREAVC